jgi:PilZ domain
MRPRRRVPRQSADVRAICLLEGEDATVGWRECRILDISTLGIGITFRHRRLSELSGRKVSVEVPSASESVSVRLEGQIKNAQMIQPGLVRVGIELVAPSTSEQALGTVLSALSEADASDTMLVFRMADRT